MLYIENAEFYFFTIFLILLSILSKTLGVTSYLGPGECLRIGESIYSENSVYNAGRREFESL